MGLFLMAKLKNNHKLIEIQDFGAGSKKLGQKRKISSIFKMSSSKGKYGKLLFRLAKHFEFQNVLEFGTSLGTGTLHLHLGNPLAEINTIEACKETFLVAKENLFPFNNIHQVNETFDYFLSHPKNIKFDFIFVDGHHDGQALLKYMEKLKEITHSETIFLLDDIRWSDSMFDAWNKIVSDENYHLTIDLFRMGIVVPRPQQQKEHFILKI